MERLLLPLLAALALPTAVSANFICLDYGSNNYQDKHLLISYGSGGGGNSQEEKQSKKLNKKRQSFYLKKDKLKKKLLKVSH